jgi:DNA-binding response OmpR family regulator
LVCAVLARHGWRTIEAVDGVEALGLGMDERVDLLITDFEMPTITGLELAKQARRRTPELPILLISGRPALAAVARNHGYRFLPKPFDLDELMAMVRSLTSQPPDGPRAQSAAETEFSIGGGMAQSRMS